MLWGHRPILPTPESRALGHTLLTAQGGRAREEIKTRNPGLRPQESKSSRLREGAAVTLSDPRAGWGQQGPSGCSLTFRLLCRSRNKNLSSRSPADLNQSTSFCWRNPSPDHSLPALGHCVPPLTPLLSQIQGKHSSALGPCQRGSPLHAPVLT